MKNIRGKKIICVRCEKEFDSETSHKIQIKNNAKRTGKAY